MFTYLFLIGLKPLWLVALVGCVFHIALAALLIWIELHFPQRGQAAAKVIS